MKANYVRTSLIDVMQEIKAAKFILVQTTFGTTVKITKKMARSLLSVLESRGVTHINICITPAWENANVIIMDAIT